MLGIDIGERGRGVKTLREREGMGRGERFGRGVRIGERRVYV
jgi:hypothetical protein